MGYDDSGATRLLNGFDADLSPEINRNKNIAFIDKIKAEKPNLRLILFLELTFGYCYRSSNISEYINSITETILGTTNA
jgi:tagatose-1,6-bisphosphate aldolase